MNVVKVVNLPWNPDRKAITSSTDSEAGSNEYVYFYNQDGNYTASVYIYFYTQIKYYPPGTLTRRISV